MTGRESCGHSTTLPARAPDHAGPRHDARAIPPRPGRTRQPGTNRQPDSLNRTQAAKIPAMAHRRGGLLAQIEAGVLDDIVPLSSLLQKCIVLGGQAGSEKMRDWARRELNGYACGVPILGHWY